MRICLQVVVIYVLVSIVFIQIVQALALLNKNETENTEKNHEEKKSLRRVLESLANLKSFITNGGRRLFRSSSDKGKSLLESLRKKMSGRGKHYLRQEVANTVGTAKPFENTEYEGLVEKELKDTESKHSAQILDQAWIEKKGRNDFLVLHPDLADPFATIIPNNVYYGIEKKCANWLDSCSLQGIRAKLLESVKWPYRKK